MAWNYRPHKTVFVNAFGREEEYWTVRSTYYNRDGEITMFSIGYCEEGNDNVMDRGTQPYRETAEELKGDLVRMLKGVIDGIDQEVFLTDDMEFGECHLSRDRDSKLASEIEKIVKDPEAHTEPIGDFEVWFDKLRKQAEEEIRDEYQEILDSSIKLEGKLLEMKEKLDPEGKDPMLTGVLDSLNELRTQIKGWGL